MAAEALFQRARELIKQGDYAAGCPKFEASLALQPSASTMINIARCHEHEGKTATAWVDYHRALVLNQDTQGVERRKELEALANEGIAALEPRLPRLRIVIASPPRGLKVLRDGKAVPPTALGEALPTDPGRCEVAASAPGYRPELRAVTLAEGNTATVELSLQPSATPSDEAHAPPAPPSERAPSRALPAWVWGVGAAGIALTGAGLYFLADDLSAISALRSHCHTRAAGTFCAPSYRYQDDNARKDRDLGLFLGLGGAGVAALAAAVYALAATGPARQPAAHPTMAVAPWGGPGALGATISGGF